jgi:3-deoxy-D-manno-octulosonic-acid transferase
MRVTEQIDQALKKLIPNLRTTWAVRRRETIAAIENEHPDQAIAFMPFDFIVPARNFVNRMQPDVVVMVEKLWVPNIAWVSRLSGARVMAANATTGSYLSSLFSPINRWTLSAFHLIVLQSESERAKLGSLLSKLVPWRIGGTLKTANFESAAPREELQKWLATARAPLVAAGSTHEDEEKLVIQALQQTRQNTACKLLIAPRRLHRVDEICARCERYGLAVSRLSEYEKSTSRDEIEADVYILDTLGDLNAAYAFAVAAYVGGTRSGAGHNVLEPVVHGKAVCFGPGALQSGGQSTSMQQACIEAEVGYRVASSEELAEHWTRILQNSELQTAIAARCKGLINAQNAALAANVEAIIEQLAAAGFGVHTPNN